MQQEGTKIADCVQSSNATSSEACFVPASRSSGSTTTTTTSTTPPNATAAILNADLYGWDASLTAEKAVSVQSYQQAEFAGACLYAISILFSMTFSVAKAHSAENGYGSFA